MINVIFHQPVEDCEQNIQLFEREIELPFVPYRGLLLVDVPGIANVSGPTSGFDNVIQTVLYSGKRKKLICGLAGFREATMNCEEVHASLPGWTYVGKIGKATAARKLGGIHNFDAVEPAPPDEDIYDRYADPDDCDIE
jgi:hypothetical protein